MTLTHQLFQAALHLSTPWEIKEIKFTESDKELHIWIDFKQGSKFPCSKCGALNCNVHDTSNKTWRHLNFFEHKTFIHGRIPRTDCEQCNGIHQVNVPWARERSGFTILMESFIVFFAQTMQISQIAEKLHLSDKRVWRVVAYYVNEALKNEDHSKISEIGIDETSRKKGHNYITVIADLKTGKVVYICKGRDYQALSSFSKSLNEHKSSPDQVEQICCDMSPAYIKGIKQEFPLATIIFDKFHVMKIINRGVDLVRREEQGVNRVLKKTRYIWLKNPLNLTEKQRLLLGSLKEMNLKTSRAYNLKLSFSTFWSILDPVAAEKYLKKWYFWATHCKLPSMIEAAKTIKAHWEGILNYFRKPVTNGLLEGINSLIQSLKANARGYRNDENFMTMIYLRLGQLKFNLPT